MRSLFKLGFQSPSPWEQTAPHTLAVRVADIRIGQLKSYLKKDLPPGYAGGEVRVVKILDGEFLVYPDGTAQFVQIGRSPGPRFVYDPSFLDPTQDSLDPNAPVPRE